MNFFYSNQKAGEDLRLTSHSPELAAVLLRDRPGVSLAAWAVKGRWVENHPGMVRMVLYIPQNSEIASETW